MRHTRRMVPMDKLLNIIRRFEFLEARLSAGAAHAEIASLSREYSDLKPVVGDILAYRQALDDLAEAELLLQDPEILRTIVAAVRAAVPAHIPVTAKMRLGYNDDSLALDCALALEAGGAAEIVVHARTKAQGYRPPAYWDRVADVREAVRVPVAVNGEIWTVEDAQAAVAQSGCQIVMLGRGIVARPALARSVLAALGSVEGSIAQPGDDWSWEQMGPLMHAFWQVTSTQLEKKQQAGRVKQWLNLLRRHYPQAQTAFDEMRTLVKPSDVEAWLQTSIPV